MKRFNTCFNHGFFCFLLMLLILVSAACVPQHYSESDRKNVEETSRKLLTAWMETLPEAGELSEVSMIYGSRPGENPYSGYYLSQVSFARFTAGGKSYEAYVNNEDGQIWTDYYGIDAGKYLEELLKPYCEAHGYAAELHIPDVYPVYRLLSHGTDAWNNSDQLSEVYIANTVYPAEITAESAGELMPEFLKCVDINRAEITFISDTGLSFDPKILTDLTEDTKKHRDEAAETDTNPTDITVALDIRMNVGNPEDKAETELEYSPYPKCGYAELIQYEDASELFFRFQEYGHQKVDTIYVEYIKKYWQGAPADYDYASLNEESCTVLFGDSDDGEFRYTGDNDHFAYLFFADKPEYTKALRSYIGGAPDKVDTDELSITEINGVWTLDNEEKRYAGGFYLEPHMPQMIIFEK